MAVRLAIPRFPTLVGKFLLIAAGLLNLSAKEVASPAEPNELQAFPAQLYTWGWSQPLAWETVPWSMQSRLAEAADRDLEVIWWTERLGLFDQSQDLAIPLEQGQVDPTTLNIVRMPGDAGSITSLVADIQGGKPQVRLQDGWLEMSLTSDLEAQEFQSFSYRPRGPLGKPQSFLFARPLACRPQWQMEVELPSSASTSPVMGSPTPSSPEDIAVEIHFELSAHGLEEPTVHRLIYRLLPAGSAEPAEVQVRENAEVVIPLLLQPRVNRLKLDLAAAAERLPQGEDNVISDVSVVVRARRGATARLRWRRPRLISQRPQAQDLLAAFLAHSIQSRETYGLAQGIGGTYSRDHQPFLSAFLPPFNTAYALLLKSYRSPAEWVAGVQAVRGLVAYHLGMLAPETPAESTPNVEPLDQRTRILQVATALLQNRAYGADLLAFEAGTAGGWETSAQLAVWDILLANGLALGGVGVAPPTAAPLPTASSPPTPETRWISWLWAQDRTGPDLLAALRDRRVFFGDPEGWEGTLDLRLTDASGRREYGRMGGKMKVAEAQAFLHLEGRFQGPSQVRIIQGLMRPGRSVRYLRQEAVADPSQPVPLETREACFVRVEVWNGKALAVCSNPLLIYR